jgi:hypothetical protein
MKLLYIDICSSWINPTNPLILALLRLGADVVCYGPGFVDEDVLNAGLDKFVEKHEGFDFHVATILNLELREVEILYYSRYAFPTYRFELVKAFASDAAAFLKRSNVPKILFLTGLDTYALSEEYAQLIAELNGHIVAWAGGFSKPISEFNDVFVSEEYYARYKGKRDFGRWHDVVSKFKRKFINLGHFIAETEFAWNSLSYRRDKVVVPGQMYVRREAARRKLAEQGDLARTGQFKFLVSAMDHLGLRPHARPLLRLLYNQTFVQSIRSARYAYTDGSGDDYPIRKFFEIPALGTLLLCTPCAGFEQLGFSDRKNAVVVAPDTIGDAVEWLRKSPNQAQEIADAGRRLIWDRHSLHARAEQFARCMKSIATDRFLGSRWDNGDFVVDESSGTLASSPSGSSYGEGS